MKFKVDKEKAKNLIGASKASLDKKETKGHTSKEKRTALYGEKKHGQD